MVGGRLSECVSWPLNSGLIGVQMRASHATHVLPHVPPHVSAITIPHSLRATTRARHYNTTFASCYHTCPLLQYHIRFVLSHVPAITIPYSLRATTRARHYNTTRILFVLSHVPAITIPHSLRAMTPAPTEYYVL